MKYRLEYRILWGEGIDSYIFSWTALYDPIRAIDALKNLPTLKESDWMASKTRMVINNKFEIGFHFRDLGVNLFDDKGNLNQKEFDEGLEELLSRMTHLIEKTEHLFANDDDQDVLFVFKTEFYKPEYKKYHNVLYVISYLYAVLKEKFVSRARDFFLLVLSDDKMAVNKVNCAHIADNILVQHIMFYPDNTKRKIRGDKLGWNLAFNNALLAFSDYKLSKYTNNISPRLDDGHWASKKQFQFVIVYKLDRFARNKVESVINKKTLQDNGVSLLSAMERITDTPEGHMMETILEGFNQYFSEELAQKVKRGMRETRLKGLYQGGGVPYGYKVEGRKVVVDESAAEIVRYAFQEYSKGAFVLEIIDTLHKKGLLYKGKPFPRNLLYHVLRNEKYTGSYKCRDEVVDNIYPQIIPVELFQKVGARLEKNRYGKRSFEATYLLKFKAKCGYCGMPMYSETGTASNGETKRYYKCGGKKKYHNGCTKSQVRKEYLEEIVVNAIVDELNRPGAIEFITKKLLEAQDENIKNNSAVNALVKEKTKIDKQLENIANAIQNGIVSKTTAKRLQDLEEQQEKLEREILIEQSRQAVPLTKAQIKEFYLDALEMEPRMLIEYLVKEVILYDDKIQIIFKSPINAAPDEDRGFLLSAKFCKPKKVISSRSSTKRKIMVEIRVE